MLRQLKVRRQLAPIFCLLCLGSLTLSRLSSGERPGAIPAALIASSAPAKIAASARAPALSWSRVHRDGDGFVEVMPDGGHAELTLDPRLQQKVERVFKTYAPPYAAAVLLSVDDGRVLAMTGHSSVEPDKGTAELVLKPWAPAASIFKLVTAAALLERGVSPDARVCYHDGVHSVEASNLKANPRWDEQCNTFSFGVSKSQNAIIARLAHDHLDARALEQAAHALGFGEALPFDLPVERSQVILPAGELGFARVAAGFWQTTLSPLHGAYLAATLARGGVTPPLRLIDRIVDAAGNHTQPPAPEVRRVLDAAHARAIARMMVGTTEFGTARLAFHDRRNRPLLPGIAVAGKTGSLERKDPYLSYSWFVGFAPASRPEVAVAVLLGNGPSWRVKAHQVARELLSGYFAGDAPATAARLAQR
jgi:cell division protein FtsI/penicillin-binding protein 2